MAKNKTQDKLINLQAQQLAAQVANWAAQLDFQKERFRLLEMPQFQQGLQLDVDKFAWQKAQDTWERSYQESLLTGMYQGKPTTQWLLDQAKLTGTWNGQRTLEGKLTDAQIQDMHDKMKLANDEFLSATTGYFNGQKTFDREKFEAAQALDGWKFIATLSGPQNAFKQARAIASMPGGMGQLMDAFAGQYMLPSGSAVGSGGATGAAGQLADMHMGWGGNYAPGAPGAGALPGPGTLPVGTIPPPPPSGPMPGPPGQPGQPAPGQPVNGDPNDPGFRMWLFANGRADVSGGELQHNMDTYYGLMPPESRSYFTQLSLYQSDPGFLTWVQANGRQNLSGNELLNNLQTYMNFIAGNNPLLPPNPAPTQPIGTSGTVPQTQDVVNPGAAPHGTVIPGASTGFVYSPPGVQAPVGAYNYSGTADGSVAVYPPGVMSPPQTADVSSTTPQNPAAVQSAVNQPYQYGQGANYATNAPAPPAVSLLPNQINAENYGNAYQYQKDLMWAGYEDAGWDKGLAQEAFLKSLPKYGGVSKGSYAF